MNTSQRGLALLGPELLSNRQIVRLASHIAKVLRTGYGWHYHLDFVWIVNSLIRCGIKPGSRVLDAGAGNGVLQFLLASLGYHVISVDYSERTISRRIRLGYRITEVSPTGVFSHPYLEHLSRATGPSSGASKSNFRDMSLPWLLLNRARAKGSVVRMQADMRDMRAVDSGTVDAVVSLSAIEHLDRENIASAVTEFHRVLKPDHPMIITTSASEKETWFHEPSRGLCFSAEDLGTLFTVSPAWGSYPEHLQAIRESAQLRELLHPSYLLSGNNGMPWGKWNPQYVPVGIVS